MLMPTRSAFAAESVGIEHCGHLPFSASAKSACVQARQKLGERPSNIQKRTEELTPLAAEKARFGPECQSKENRDSRLHCLVDRLLRMLSMFTSLLPSGLSQPLHRVRGRMVSSFAS